MFVRLKRLGFARIDAHAVMHGMWWRIGDLSLSLEGKEADAQCLPNPYMMMSPFSLSPLGLVVDVRGRFAPCVFTLISWSCKNPCQEEHLQKHMKRKLRMCGLDEGKEWEEEG